MEALFILLLLYLGLPFMELGIIIALAVSRSHYKRMAETYRAEAERVRNNAVRPVGQPSPVMGQPSPAAGQPSPVMGHRSPAAGQLSPVMGHRSPSGGPSSPDMVQRPPSAGQPTLVTDPRSPAPRPSQPAMGQPPAASVQARPLGGHQLQQGTIPFVIGVIFVILAGFIFATTTWSILPSFMKAVMVLLVTFLFYGASIAAVKKLSIIKTGKAFYILGTIFLFVSVLAFGYFGLFGPAMTPLGDDWQRLYLIGMVLTEAGLLFGLRLFREKLYAVLCLAGITAAAALFLASLKLQEEWFAVGMALFGTATLYGDRLIRNRENRIASGLQPVYGVYASINLWLVSLLVLLWTGFGLLSGAAALIVGGAHFLRGKSAKTEEPETVAFAVFLITGIARLASPGVLDDWLYLVTVTMLLITILDTFGCFGTDRKKGFLLVHMLLGACTMLLLALSPLDGWSVDISALICMGLFLADVTIAAWRQETALLKTVHSMVLILFFHYGVIYLDVGMENGLFLLILLMGTVFGAGMKGWYPFKNQIGEIMNSVLVLAYVAFLLLLRLLKGVWESNSWPFWAAIISVFVLTAVVWGWGRKNRAFRPLCLFALWPVLLPVMQLTKYAGQTAVQLEWFAFGYLLAVSLWDLWVRKEMEPDCLIHVTIIGLASAVLGFDPYGGNLPFFLCLSMYLFLKYRRMDGGKQKTVCLYLSGTAALVGFYIVSVDFTDHLLLRILWPSAALAAADFFYLSGIMGSKDDPGSPGRRYLGFSAVSGSVLYAAAAAGFYMDDGLDILCLAVLAAFFLWQYGKSCFMEQPWCHLLPSLVTLPLPGVLYAVYGVDSDVIYTAVMVVLVFSTALTRKYMPVFEKTGETGFWIDWFHILVILPVVFMCILAPVREWQFVYMLLTAGYFLQFLNIPCLKRFALTASGISGCIAFWIQPFVTWPALIRPEILLIPAAALIWSLPFIWGRSRLMENIQTGLYLLCLGSLTVNALVTGKPADALILEGICLAVFFGAYYKKYSRWIRLSGGLAVGIVLYMTRAFWLSLAWWVYLLAAGVGLILFAAFNEMKKR